MKKKILIPSLLFLAVVILASFALTKPAMNGENVSASTNVASIPSGIVLFYGIGCPFCEQVDAYIEEQGIEEQVSFERKEVYYNKDNSNELSAVASVCGLSTIGVPFLWDGENCYVGMPDIVSFFDQKIIDIENE
ncbi:MAG: hypothetical protein WDZ74_02440 [Candidatus Paceibacterota bacterium]